MIDTVIIGAGPYGLSTAAHLHSRGVPFRIFGRPMDSWTAHMPKGMRLKSDGFASNLYDPDGKFTLRQFCAEQGVPYADEGNPVSLETFAAYGVAFRERVVPELDERLVTSVEQAQGGFRLGLEDGETVTARRVVVAVGITHFAYVPRNLSHLPAEFLSHSFDHHDLEPFRGRSVAVIGGGASATDLAGLLHESGADVQLVARRRSLHFHSRPESGKSRSWWQRMRHPKSGLGPGLRSRIFSEAPNLFRYLPEGLRLEIVRRHLGPAGGWFAKEKVVGRVPLLLGYTAERAVVQDGGVCLHLRAANGTEREIHSEHIIAATGYRVEINRMSFLSSDIRSRLQALDQAPVLSSKFESSVPGLYFVGLAAANSFGPVMRFAFGAGFAARRVTQALAKSCASRRFSMATRDLTALPVRPVDK